MVQLSSGSSVRGSIRAGFDTLAGRLVMSVVSTVTPNAGALGPEDGRTMARAADAALRSRVPLVLSLDTSGADIMGGVAALDGWGHAARAICRCSGIVPILALVSGRAISGPALMLGMADIVVMTAGATAYVSSPEAVVGVTGEVTNPETLGGSAVHAARTGLSAMTVPDARAGLELLGELLAYLPDHVDVEPPVTACEDPPWRATPSLHAVVPTDPTIGYDVRDVLGEIVDHGHFVELRGSWAPQVVTGFARLGGQPCGVVANQPSVMAGTLDIDGSRKGAAFVRMCDAFNLPLLTIVDTPGFLPGKDLEWRGMIRYGAELAFAYCEATVPRVCLVLRKAYGGAYIVMDSKGIGNDLCFAWPCAEIAVMGAKGAMQILDRRGSADARRELEEQYASAFLTPWVGAARGFVDDVIDPADSRRRIVDAFAMLMSKRDRVVDRKHDVGPL